MPPIDTAVLISPVRKYEITMVSKVPRVLQVNAFTILLLFVSPLLKYSSFFELNSTIVLGV
jgi:hypothetical protein